MGNTPNHNIYFLSNGDPQSQVTESATQAGTVEAALDSVSGNIESVNNFGVQYFANASARDLALVSPTVGWLTQLDSELFMRRWNGSAWVPFGSGLYPLFPSSVGGTGVVVASDGCVDFTSASAVNINGVFSSEFRDYQIEFESTGASTNVSVLFRFRASGIDSNTDYLTHSLAGSGTSVAAATSGETTASYLCLSAGTQIISRMVVYSPAAARQTVARANYSGFSNAPAGFEGILSNRHAASAAYDGITVYPNSGTFTGHIRIFGVG